MSETTTPTNEGVRAIETALAKAQKADPADAPFPLVGEEAALWHRATASAYLHALEMMAPAPFGPAPMALSHAEIWELCRAYYYGDNKVANAFLRDYLRAVKAPGYVPGSECPHAPAPHPPTDPRGRALDPPDGRAAPDVAGGPGAAGAAAGGGGRGVGGDPAGGAGEGHAGEDRGGGDEASEGLRGWRPIESAPRDGRAVCVADLE